MIKKLIVLTISILFTISLSSCASIIDGTTQEVSFNSEPQDVEVTIDGKVIGKTPVAIQLDKKSGRTVEFYLEGYKRQTRSLETTINPWFFGNIITGGLIGSSTDATSGAMYEYSPDSFFIELVPEEASQLEMETYLAEAQLRKFILFNHRQIIRDSSLEQGEYLDALSELLSVKTEMQKADFAAQLLKLHEDNPTSPEFAERIVMLFKTRPLKIKAVADFR